MQHTIVFDLDGTLIDTAPDLILATNHVLVEAGFDPTDEEFIRPFISFGTRRMIEEGVKHQGRTLSQAQHDAMFKDLIAFYSNNMTIASVPFPGMVGTLEALKARGMTVAICTNKMEGMAKQLMKELGLDHHFATITGRDTFPVCKPDPEHLFGAIRYAGGAPAHSVMVGDSTTDYATAKAAGIPIIGVTFGYTDVPMANLECEGLISHYDDFIDTLDQVIAA